MAVAVNLLLVDDEPKNLAALESILDCPDYRLTKAQSAQEALTALVSADFALIILDVKMPETSGFELAQLIKGRKKTRDIPIILLTAHYAADQDVLSGYSAGAVDYLTKPFHPAILKSKVAVFAELYRKTQALNQANEALNRRNEELIAANKELEAFSYSVSHDLRAPVRHISGFTERLRQHASAKLDERARRYLHLIQQSAREMGTLIDQLLGFSRMGRTELRLSPVEMNSLVHEVIDSFRPEIQKRSIEWQVAHLPLVEVDPELMRVVWVNLLSNAIKYTRPRNPARIEIGCDSSQRECHVFFVRDNGVGFDMRYHHKLFGVFQRLHDAHEFEGTGIGLATVRRIIDRHGGHAWAEATLEAGATVSFALKKQMVLAPPQA